MIIIKYDSKTKIKRSKNGCFNCRKRKKKCNELKPSCSYCSLRFIPCVWPDDEITKLPKEYQIPKVDQSLKISHQNTPVIGFVPVEFATTAMNASFKPRSLRFLTPFVLGKSKIDDIEEEYNGEIFNLAGPRSSIKGIQIDFPSSLFNDLSLTTNFEDTFKWSCLNGFIKAISVQYTHPLLTTDATFSEFVDNNPIMEAIAISCGCSYLAWNDPSLNEMAYNKFQNALNLMLDYLETNVFAGDDIWVCAGMVMLCIGSKCIFHCTTQDTIINLRSAYQIIKYMMMNKTRKNEQDPIIGPERIEDAYFEDSSLMLESLKMDIENSLIHFNSNNLTNMESNDRFERMFIETFTYNFSVTCLVSSKTDDLPNPYVVFKELRNVLKTPLFSCDVSWMNNPVFGAAFDSYELAAKSSYLIRNINDPKTLPAARRLFEAAKFTSVPIIPTELRVNSSKYKSLKDSTISAEIILEATKILLLKIINIHIRESNPIIQNHVESIIMKLNRITDFSQCKVILTWTVFICGVCCINNEQRIVIVKNCSEIGEIVHGSYVFSGLKALYISWGKTKSHYLSGEGINVLLDGQFLSEITL